MKNLNVSLTPASGASGFAFSRARAFSLAESDPELVEPELIAWVDRATGVTSPIRTGPKDCVPLDEWIQQANLNIRKR